MTARMRITRIALQVTRYRRIQAIAAAQVQSLAAWDRRLARQLAQVHDIVGRLSHRMANRRRRGASSTTCFIRHVVTYRILYFSLASVHTSRWGSVGTAALIT